MRSKYSDTGADDKQKMPEGQLYTEVSHPEASVLLKRRATENYFLTGAKTFSRYVFCFLQVGLCKNQLVAIKKLKGEKILLSREDLLELKNVSTCLPRLFRTNHALPVSWPRDLVTSRGHVTFSHHVLRSRIHVMCSRHVFTSCVRVTYSCHVVMSRDHVTWSRSHVVPCFCSCARCPTRT